MSTTPITEESVNEWLAANPRLVQDDHNKDLMVWFVDYMAKKGRESEISIESLSAFCSANSGSLHWLRDENEIKKAASAAAKTEAARIAALPPPPKQPEKLKGLTTAERLASVGVAASPHQSHADKRENDNKAAGSVKQVANQLAQVQRNLERQAKIEEARSIVVYREGPGGRIDHGATETARRNALAKLGIRE